MAFLHFPSQSSGTPDFCPNKKVRTAFTANLFGIKVSLSISSPPSFKVFTFFDFCCFFFTSSPLFFYLSPETSQSGLICIHVCTHPICKIRAVFRNPPRCILSPFDFLKKTGFFLAPHILLETLVPLDLILAASSALYSVFCHNKGILTRS